MTGRQISIGILVSFIFCIAGGIMTDTGTAYGNPVITDAASRFSEFLEKRPEDRVYLHFDKPFYFPGETIWFQAYVRNGADMKPSGQSEILHVEFINPRGNKEREFQLIARDGTAAGDIELDEGAAGGIYKVRAYTNWQKNDADPFIFEKEITVQKAVLPTLKMNLDFAKEAYGPGDRATAVLKVETLDNQPLANKPFRYTVALKGETILEKKGKTTAKGAARIGFDLPKDLSTPDGLLNVLISHQGKTESISRSIPILMDNISVEFFPEGGDLVDGITSRVAFRVLNGFGKPADVSGSVFDDKGKRVAEFESYHQGMGAFRMTPEKDGKYHAKIEKPAGITRHFPIPDALPRGYALEAATRNDSIALTIRSTENEELSVIVQMRGRILHTASVPAETGDNRLEIPAANFPMGVAQITLFDSKGIERCERLVFVNRDRTLNIDVQTDKKQYLPREKVRMTVRTTDERGMPIPSVLSLAVTDDKIISFADDKSGNILSKLLLEPDLKTDVYEPRFYFDETEEKSPEALDYLLMTRGWRRFEWREVMKNPEFHPGHQAEKATVTGVVYEDYSGKKPSKGATVKVMPDGKTYVTDENGEFAIRDLDLYDPAQFIAERGKQSGPAVFVSDYGTPITLYLGHRIYRTRAAVPMDDFDGVFAMAGAAPKAMAKEMAPPPEIQEGAVNKDMRKKIPDARQPKQEEAEFEMADEAVFDLVIQREPPPIPPPETLYYRARVFAAPVYDDKTPVEVRTDFRSTVFWKGDIEIGRDGKTEIEFCNSDEITAFRAVVEGIAADGLVGRKEYVYHTQLPFSMDVKVPVEVTMGDEIRIPLTLVNNTDDTISGELKIIPPKAWVPIESVGPALKILAGSAKTVFLPFNVLNLPGRDMFTATFASRSDRDAFTKEITVSPKGFPVSVAVSAKEVKKEFGVRIVNSVPGTIRANLTAYPTILSDMLAGIESILREPYGCFEQTSSSTYPNILVLEYLREHEAGNPAILERAEKLIDKGYKRLISFETREKGYEWFGSVPAHEALTAYGLMEFYDMKRVYPDVDNDMTDRTAKWLMSRKDGKGGFKKSPRALDSFGRADDEITNAYIVYALTEAGFIAEIRDEIERAVKTAEKSTDPYQMALVANALFNIGDKRAGGMLKSLMKRQNKDGCWKGKSHSVTRSTGMALKMETTALAILAALKSKTKDANAINNGVRFIVEKRSPHGGFGNTQSTVLALKALTEYTKFSKRTAEPGTIRVLVGDRKIGEISYEAGENEPIVINGLETFFKDGNFAVSVEYAGVKDPLPYTFSLEYSTHTPPSSEEKSVGLETAMSAAKVKMGEIVRMTARLKNLKEDDGLPMTLGILGIPGGLSPQPWQLKELLEKKIVDAYEVIGNQVVLYYRQMTPGETREINLDLKAEIPGKFEGQASRAYLYYTNEHKSWTAGEQIEVLKTP